MAKKKTIIASESFDNSTDRVMEWLDYFGSEPIRINNLHEFFNEEFELDLTTDSQGKYNIWFRRPDTRGPSFEAKKKHIHKSQKTTKKRTAQLIELFNHDLTQENHSLAYNYWKTLSTNNSLGTIANLSPNKLGQLRVASKLGMDIPDTIITNSRKRLLKFLKKWNNQVITKCIDDSFLINYKEKTYSMFTEEVTKKMAQNLPKTFFRTLFQEKLDKDFEIRSFYLKGKFYSMAIFSQKDKRTKVDFRKYNESTPNRIVRYNLPKELESKTKKLMKKLKLDTGSIDFVKTKDNRIVYLEVNPVGQFGMVSEPCNYMLEKLIAQELTS